MRHIYSTWTSESWNFPNFKSAHQAVEDLELLFRSLHHSSSSVFTWHSTRGISFCEIICPVYESNRENRVRVRKI